MMVRRQLDPETQFEKALELLARGNQRKALRQLRKLLPLTTDNPGLAEQANLVIADISLSLRQLSQTIRHAEVVIGLNPENDQAYYLLGFAHSVEMNWDKSVLALRKALSLVPPQEAAEYHRALGWALFNQNPAEAEGLEHLEKALQMAPTQTPILTDLAMAYAQMQDFEQALDYAQRAAKLDPSDRQAQEMVDALTQFQGRHKRQNKGQKRFRRKALPSTEAEWRALIAETDNPNELVELWLEVHPAKDIDEANESLAELMALWNSTPRAELGGRSPNEMA